MRGLLGTCSLLADNVDWDRRLYIPRVPTHEDILRVSSHSSCLPSSPTLVNTIDSPEAINENLMVRQRARRTRLEGNIVTPRSRIKDIDSRENRVDINTTATLGVVRGRVVRNNSSSVPVLLQMAQERRRNSAGLASLPQSFSEGLSLDESLVLHSSGKKRSSVDFLPQVESSLVPVLAHVREIIPHNRPDVLNRLVALTLLKEMVSVRNKSRSTHGRTVALRTTPGTSVRGQVDVELRLTESRTVGERAGGVGDGLDLGLGGDVLLDEWLEGGVSGEELMDQGLHCQAGVAGPGVDVWLRFTLAIASGECKCAG